ncbi:MAG: hypothetical protein NZ942_03360 [Candidatus Aenigmarchaeota archaeon]|nr:hypothetical protein [Candidatus Aenigmarchaeota archaeon]
MKNKKRVCYLGKNYCDIAKTLQSETKIKKCNFAKLCERKDKGKYDVCGVE